MSYTETLEKLRADYYAQFKQSRGTLEGVEAAWKEAEPEMVLAAQSLIKQASATAAREAEEQARLSTPRSTMTAAQKAEFVHQHGVEAFQALPA